MLRLGSTEVRARFTFLGSQFKIQTRPDKFCLEKKHLNQSSLVIFVILL